MSPSENDAPRGSRAAMLYLLVRTIGELLALPFQVIGFLVMRRRIRREMLQILKGRR